MQNGEADVMLSGGAEAAITPLSFGGFCAMKVRVRVRVRVKVRVGVRPSPLCGFCAMKAAPQA